MLIGCIRCSTWNLNYKSFLSINDSCFPLKALIGVFSANLAHSHYTNKENQQKENDQLYCAFTRYQTSQEFSKAYETENTEGEMGLPRPS